MKKPRFRILPERPYRELQGRWGGFLRFSRWSVRADVRPLREDEAIIVESLAHLLAGLEPHGPWQRWTHKIFAPQGWLRLTDQRLIWMPQSPRYLPRSGVAVVDIELGDVIGVERGYGGWPARLFTFYMPLFRIDLRTGQTYVFQAPFGGTLRNAIAKAAGLLEDD